MNLKLLSRNKYLSELRKCNISKKKVSSVFQGILPMHLLMGLSSSILFFNLDSIIHCYC